MVSALTRALFAALVVGGLPGWLWARCLCATADFAERLAYSVELSITLVPAAALVGSAGRGRPGPSPLPVGPGYEPDSTLLVRGPVAPMVNGAAREVSAALAGVGADPRSFSDAGFRVIQVKGPLYQLVPPGDRYPGPAGWRASRPSPGVARSLGRE